MIYQDFLILLLEILYFIIFTEGTNMLFLASNMYCKYVIDTIYASLKKSMCKNHEYDELNDKLYESYLMLEKLLDVEIY